MNVVLIVLVIWLTFALTVCCQIIARQWKEITLEERADHAKCMSMIAAFVADEFVANALDSAAERYDSMDGQAAIRRIAKTAWAEDGPSIPALVLIEQAKALRAKHTHEMLPEEKPEEKPWPPTDGRVG